MSRTEATREEYTATRRGFLSTLGVATTIGLGVPAASRTGIALADDAFTATDVSVNSKNGKVDDVWVQPRNLTYSWNGLDTDPESLQFSVLVDDPSQNGDSKTGTGVGSMSVLGNEQDDNVGSGPDGLERSGSFSFQSEYSLIDDGPWSKKEFRNKQSGTTQTVSTIEIAVRGTLTTDGGTYVDVRRAAFDVNVTREKGGTGNGR